MRVSSAQPLDDYAQRIYSPQVIAWDEAKRRTNLRKHGFDFVDAELVFDGVTYTYEDDRLGSGGQRRMTTSIYHLYAKGDQA